MKVVIRFVMLTGLLALLLSSGWVCYSEEKECPWPPKSVGKADFLSAHGLTQDNYSIWLKEHSEWRRKYSDELKNYSFIPQDYDQNRR